MKQDVKKLIIFFLLAAAIIYATDFVLGSAFEKLYDRMTVGEKARANFFIKKASPEVIVFGSSRALYHYNSKILSDSLQQSVYNAGRSNQTILYHVALLKSSLRRYTPNMVILDLNEDELVASRRKYEYLSAFMPYTANNPDLRDAFYQANPNYRYWSWSKLLPYNSSAFATLYRGLIARGKDKDIDGYLKHGGKLKGPKETVDNCGRVTNTDPALAAALDEFIHLCKQNNITLHVFISPRYTDYTCDRGELKELLRQISSKNVEIHNMTALISDPQLFADAAHLNTTGATAYTTAVAKTLLAK